MLESQELPALISRPGLHQKRPQSMGKRRGIGFQLNLSRFCAVFSGGAPPREEQASKNPASQASRDT
jgi:hypothetical protein